MQSNNYHLLSLLVGCENFQKYVKKVRTFLGIPENGFSKNEDIERWAHERDRKDSLYLSSLRYKNHNQNIRAKMTYGEIDRSMANKQLKVFDDTYLHTNYLTSACAYVVDRFHLPFNIGLAIRLYILTNQLTYIPVNNFAYVPNLKSGKVATMEVYASLTKEEEKSLLKMVRGLTKDFPKIKNISDNTMQQLSFEDWHKNRDKYSEKITAKDIAKETFGSGNERQKVYDAKRSLDKQRKKRFG